MLIHMLLYLELFFGVIRQLSKVLILSLFITADTYVTVNHICCLAIPVILLFYAYFPHIFHPTCANIHIFPPALAIPIIIT